MMTYVGRSLRLRAIFLALLCTKVTSAWVTHGTTFEFMFISNINQEELYVHILGRENTTLTFDGPYTSLPIQTIIGSTEIVTYKLHTTFSADIAVSDIQEKGMSIESSDIVIIYLMNYGASSTDGCLLLPIPPSMFGMQYRYIAVTYATGETFIFKSLVGVVAFYQKTKVEITVRLKDSKDQVVFQGVKYKSGAVIHTYLNKHDVIQLVADTDMTGTIVITSSPISLFSGANCANVPTYSSACDHIMEQIPPTSDWGLQFVTSPLKARSAGDVFRVVAANDRTSVRDDKDTFAILSQGDFYEWEIASNKSLAIVSSGPILLVQYAKSYSADKVGDPSMLIVPSTDQYQVYYKVYIPATFTSYASLVVPSAFVKSLVVDQKFLTGATVVEILENMNITVLQIELDSGQHVIWSPNNTQFGVQAYGFHPTDVSYGFTAGGLNHINILGDQCTPGPCMNDAVCLNLENTFMCICKPGFSGTVCGVAEIVSTSITESSALETNVTLLTTDEVVLTTDGAVPSINATVINTNVTVLTTYPIILTTDNAVVATETAVLNTEAAQSAVLATENQTMVSDELSLDPSSTDMLFSTLLVTQQLTTYGQSTVTELPLDGSTTTAWTTSPVVLKSVSAVTRCPCICVATVVNRTEEEIRLLIEAIQNNLTVNTKTLSATIRKKISIYDERPSAISVGFSGVVILSCLFGMLVLMDCSVLKNYCSFAKSSSFNILKGKS